MQISNYTRCSGKYNIFATYFFSQGVNAGYGEIFPTIFDSAYNIKRNGKLIYNPEQEISNIKKILESRARKIDEYIATLERNYKPHELITSPRYDWQKRYNERAVKKASILNDMCTSNVVKNILKKSENIEEQFNLLFNHINNARAMLIQNDLQEYQRHYEPLCIDNEYIENKYIYIDNLYQILDALKCQIILNFN